MALKPLSSKTFLFLCSSTSSPLPLSSIIVSRFCTSSPTPFHSHRFHSSRRHHEEESRNVKVSVWWDFENCSLPAGVNVFKIAHTITAAIRANGIKGPVQITAFGDVFQLSRANQEALSATGINLTHIPNGGKNSADRSLLVDLMYWVSQNPPPAHVFLISGDRDFASVLHRLRMNNYNVLLASTDTAPSVLCSAASIMWRWNVLVREENLTGKVFNQPPDGPYGSWYGHYKVPLEDPFLVEQATSSQGEELTEASSETKARPIPKAVLKQIRSILSLYPKGIPIHELRAELSKSNAVIDKDFYGYKKFSRFLMSMPNILKLHTTIDGKFIARGIVAKPEPFELNLCMSTSPLTSDGNQCPTNSIKPEGEDLPVSVSMDQKSLNPSCELSTEMSARKFQQSPASVQKAVKMDVEQHLKEIGESQSIDERNVESINAQVAVENLPPAKGQDTKSEVGFFMKIWRRWFGNVDESSGIKGSVDENAGIKGYGYPHTSYSSGKNSEKKIENTLEKYSATSDSLEMKAENFEKSPKWERSPILSTSSSSSNCEPTVGEKTTVSSEPYSERSWKSHNFIDLIGKLFWGNSPNSNSLADQPSGELKHMDSYSGKHEIFCDDSFWRELESFFDSLGGSHVVLQSRTREEMARNLQKDGPLALRSLNESDVLQLVDVLISEKKWVEEHPSEASPFKLAWSIGSDTSMGISPTSNALRSIFLSTSESKRQAGHDADGKTRKIPNVSHAGVSQAVSCKKSSERSNKETLINCQKLVNEILKDFPEGYNIGSFRKLFLERYGYQIDIQKLGHRKLASLLQTMPGVKIESTYIIPSSKVPKCSIQDTDVSNIQENNIGSTSAYLGGELSDASKDDQSDSAWEELGPVDNSGPRRKKQEEKCSHPRYEPSLSDDDFSDSEGEPSTVTQSEGQAKSRVNTEDSSLLQILDSWFSSKDGVKGEDKSENVQSKNGSQPSSGNYGAKQRPQKNYSFVSVSDGDDGADNDSEANNPNKLIDGIIGSLKKSGGTRMHT